MQSTHLKKILGMAALLGAFAAPATFAATTLTATQSAPLTAGSTVDIDILVGDVSDLAAYQYSFVFDPTVLQFAGYADGGFLGGSAHAYLDGGTVDNAGGLISYAFGSLYGDVPGISGSGSLARYTFNVIGGGSTSVSFTDVLFLNSGINDIAVQYGAQVLTAVPEPSTYLMFGAGALMLAALRRRQRVAPGVAA
jgi:hypothetical protein